MSVASREPDEGHQYAHDDFETLRTLGIVGFPSMSCFELLRQSIGDARWPSRATIVAGADAALLVASLAVNVFVVLSAHGRCTPGGRRPIIFFAEVTILMNCATNVSAAHDFAEVERAMARELGTAETVALVEPA